MKLSLFILSILVSASVYAHDPTPERKPLKNPEPGPYGMEPVFSPSQDDVADAVLRAISGTRFKDCTPKLALDGDAYLLPRNDSPPNGFSLSYPNAIQRAEMTYKGPGDSPVLLFTGQAGWTEKWLPKFYEFFVHMDATRQTVTRLVYKQGIRTQRQVGGTLDKPVMAPYFDSGVPGGYDASCEAY